MKKITPILQRIKNLLHAKTDKEMAEKWGISYSTLDTWKNRDKIPEKRLLDFSLKYGVSLDWLLTGKGDPYPDSANINIVEGQQGINQQGKSNQINNPNISLGQPNKKEELSKAIRIDDPLTLSILQALEKLTEKQKAEILLQIYKMGDQEK